MNDTLSLEQKPAAAKTSKIPRRRVAGNRAGGRFAQTPEQMARHGFIERPQRDGHRAGGDWRFPHPICRCGICPGDGNYQRLRQYQPDHLVATKGGAGDDGTRYEPGHVRGGGVESCLERAGWHVDRDQSNGPACLCGKSDDALYIIRRLQSRCAGGDGIAAAKGENYECVGALVSAAMLWVAARRKHLLPPSWVRRTIG